MDAASEVFGRPPPNPAESTRPYIRPLALTSGSDAAALVAAGAALPLAGSGMAYAACEVVLREAGGEITRGQLPAAELLRWRDGLNATTQARIDARLDLLALPRPPLDLGAGAVLDFSRTAVMGVLNVTPDSFSDGGRFAHVNDALAAGRAMAAAGAAIIDVGGESTRPGARELPVADEISRVLPVIEGLADCGAALSVDTRHAAVMAAAAEAGAVLINDVSALTGDPESLSVAAGSGLPVVLMHMQGRPENMQENPRYDDVLLDVFDFLDARVGACLAAGIPRHNLIVDPGLGFGKTGAHNLELLRGLAVFHGLGCPLLVGASRKSFVGALTGTVEPAARLAGSLAAALGAAGQGAHIVRAHDVAETVAALAVTGAR